MATNIIGKQCHGSHHTSLSSHRRLAQQPVTHSHPTLTHAAHCILSESETKIYRENSTTAYAIDLPWQTRCEQANELKCAVEFCLHVEKRNGDRLHAVIHWLLRFRKNSVWKSVYHVIAELTDISYRKNQIMILINRFSAKLSVYHTFSFNDNF